MTCSIVATILEGFGAMLVFGWSVASIAIVVRIWKALA